MVVRRVPAGTSQSVSSMTNVCAPVTRSYLTYARETIVEQYYNFHVWWGAFLAEDVQFVANPGYNSDRGPVWVFSLRGHLEF